MQEWYKQHFANIFTDYFAEYFLSRFLGHSYTLQQFLDTY